MAGGSETRFARVGDVHIAYQVIGDGPTDILFVDTWVHHVEAVWDFPDFARFLRRLSSIGRLIHFDRRGTGLSDPVPLDRLPDFDTQVADVLAVLDAAGSDRPAVVGANDGTLVAILLAVAHPERVGPLVLFAPTAKHVVGDGSPEIEEVVELISANPDDSGIGWLAPSRLGDPAFERELAKIQRYSVRPGAMGHYYRQTLSSDVNDALPKISAPTLVMNRSANNVVPADPSRLVADAIPGARFVELAGTDHLIYSQNIDAVVDEIEEFLTGTRSGRDPDRSLTTIVFTDIVDSTVKAAELGDRRWRDLLERHNQSVRAQLARFGGREIKTTGDGFCATFDSPTQAVRCALAACERVGSLGIAIRAGVHTGEVEVWGEEIGGLAVHIAARVGAAAAAGEVLVSSTVRDVVAGTDLTFEDRGEHELKGVPGSRKLSAAHAAL
jgi:class 3 adenylate cyclase